MSRFTKKPVTIEAVQFLGNSGSGSGGVPIFSDGSGTVPAWLAAALDKDPHDDGAVTPNVNGTLFVMTLEGIHLANANDWIIRGVKGELYPCKPDIFELSYERADG